MAEHMWYERAQELEAENARLRANVAKLREVLKRFLVPRDGVLHHEYARYNDSVVVEINGKKLKIEDFRCARATLIETGGEDE